MPNLDVRPEKRSNCDDVLKSIEQILAEEDTEEMSPALINNSMALHAMETSFYDALKHSSSPIQFQHGHRQLCAQIHPDPFVPESDGSGWIEPHLRLAGRCCDGAGAVVNTVPSSDSECALQQFRRGEEEANRFLPRLSSFAGETGGLGHTEGGNSVEGGTKHGHVYFNGGETEGRSRKKVLASCDDKEAELSEVFDMLYLDNPNNEVLQKIPISRADDRNCCGCSRKRKHKNKQAVDLGHMPADCASAIARDNRELAIELLQQMRKQSSPLGDGSQRHAHYLANALEARLAGTGFQSYTSMDSMLWSSPVELMRANWPFTSVCPFRSMGSHFLEANLSKLAEKATTLHIIDFGISHGFQWAPFIRRLSTMAQRPPKLRITGIDQPQRRGFCPTDYTLKAGRRLSKYSERFNVPFEYNGIERRWETIGIADLKIVEGETVAVTCMLQFERIADEEEGGNSTRSMVLSLIRDINPDIFVHFLVQASYNAASFKTRFRDAQFNYWTLFDILDTTLARDSKERLVVERCFGMEMMNIIACEGSERVERAERYERWHFSSVRAGLQPVPLDRELVEQLRAELDTGYHPDFMIVEDGHWMLQGWKGRTLYAICCWAPPAQPSQH